MLLVLITADNSYLFCISGRMGDVFITMGMPVCASLSAKEIYRFSGLKAKAQKITRLHPACINSPGLELRVGFSSDARSKCACCGCESTSSVLDLGVHW